MQTQIIATITVHNKGTGWNLRPVELQVVRARDGLSYRVLLTEGLLSSGEAYRDTDTLTQALAYAAREAEIQNNV